MELTKKELVAKIEEQGHLAEAVRAKDLEIVQLKSELEKAKSEVTKARLEADKANVVLAEKVSEIKKQKQEEAVSVYQKEIDNLKNVIVQYQEANKKLVQGANRHVTTFRNLINILSGALNMATDLDELISPKKE